MTLAFLHGEILLVWLLAGALATFAAVGVGWWFWRYPPRAPILPVAIYLAITGGVLWMSDASDLFWSSLGFAVTLPWSALFLFAVMQFDVQPPTWLILPGIPLNALLIYLALRWRRRHRVPVHDGE